mgnify:CR=1 FL=1
MESILLAVIEAIRGMRICHFRLKLSGSRESEEVIEAFAGMRIRHSPLKLFGGSGSTGCGAGGGGRRARRGRRPRCTRWVRGSRRGSCPPRRSSRARRPRSPARPGRAGRPARSGGSLATPGLNRHGGNGIGRCAFDDPAADRQINQHVALAIEEAVDLFADPAGKKGLELTCYIPDGIPDSVIGDPTRLRQVLLNLVGNAVKFTQQGEVTLSVSGRIRADEKQELVFSVRDTGIGIPADRRDRLFKPFSQVDASTNRSYGGTGLGLAICKQLVACMGGSISVASTPGVGSTFTFSVVMMRCAASSAVASPSPKLQGLRALVVDDHKQSRAILRRMLESLGFAVDDTGDVERARELSAQTLYACVLLDHSLPDHAAVTLAKQMKTQHAKARPALILLRTLGITLLPADQGHFDDRVQKPARAQLLTDKIHRLLDGHSAPERKTESAISSDLPLGQRHPLRILLAEDNPINQRIAALFLQKQGYTVDIVANGREAVDAIQQRTYDLVFMDVQMPEMDGLSASALITSTIAKGQRPRIVAMTAHAMAEDKARCLAAGMDEYIQKPINADAMLAVLTATPRREQADSPSDTALDGKIHS